MMVLLSILPSEFLEALRLQHNLVVEEVLQLNIGKATSGCAAGTAVDQRVAGGKDTQNMVLTLYLPSKKLASIEAEQPASTGESSTAPVSAHGLSQEGFSPLLHHKKWTQGTRAVVAFVHFK